MSWRMTTLVVGGVVVACALAGGGLYAAGVISLPAETAGKIPTAMPAVSAAAGFTPAGAVLDGGAADGDVEEVARLDVDTLADLAGASALGDHVGAAVVELGEGTELYASNGDDAFTPASTLKIFTSAAVLEVLGPDHRFATSVVAAPAAGSAGEAEITLVGGGDPVLASTGDAAVLPAAASLESLATAVAEELAEQGVESVRLTFDDGLFSGPAVDPDWESTYVSNGVVGPVSALSVDGARRSPGLRERVDDPAEAAAEEFAELLEDEGLAVTGGSPERADVASDAVEVAGVESPPLSAIVEYLMRTSDNDVSETVARHVAIGLGRPGSSSEAGEAVVEAIEGLGVDVAGVRVADGSGLARNNALTVSSLASVVALAADPDRPHLRPVVTGLPVAGFSGTLAGRSTDGSAGYVRAKTGTLTGVHSLAGLAIAGDGTAYAFAILADDASEALPARTALDEFAAALVS